MSARKHTNSTGLTFRSGIFYICLRNVNPKPMPRKVAIAIPKMLARIAGTINEPHPLAVAIPHAVVGPPILAFDAKSNSFKSKRNSFPSPRITARWTVTWTRANTKMLGAVLMTFHTLPLAPTAAKNTCQVNYLESLVSDHIYLLHHKINKWGHSWKVKINSRIYKQISLVFFCK